MATTKNLDPECDIEIVEAKVSLWPEVGAGLEWLELRASVLYRGDDVPRGSGQPVITVPGFLSSDLGLFELRRWLGRIGYSSHASEVGINADCPDIMIEKLIETVETVATGSGVRVRLVGHSLGGVLARAAAVLRPDLISQVITLGSPVRQLKAHPLIASAARLLDGFRSSPSEHPRRHGDHTHRSTCFCDLASALDRPFPDDVARASIYSRRDGVVDWQSCRDEPRGVNVEVSASHLGMVVNKDAYSAIALLLGGAGSPENVRFTVDQESRSKTTFALP
jgi:pimeloyl-ACP methyl ester carboxylesterase